MMPSSAFLLGRGRSGCDWKGKEIEFKTSNPVFYSKLAGMRRIICNTHRWTEFRKKIMHKYNEVRQSMKPGIAYQLFAVE